MSEVKRYGHIGYLVNASERLLEAYPEMTVYIKAVDFDRVTAELKAGIAKHWQVVCDQRAKIDALQQRLTAADERADVLGGLLREAWEYDIGTPLKRKIIAALKPAEGGDDD